MSLPAAAIPPLFVVLWATGFIAARYAMPYAEPFTFLSGRFALTVGLLLILAPILKIRLLTLRENLNAVMAGILMHGLYLGGIFWAVRHGLPAGFAGLVVGLQPMLTAALAGFFLAEHVAPRQWLGLVVGLVGVAIVLSPKFGFEGVTALTVAAALGGVVAMAAGTVWQKRFLARVSLPSVTLIQYTGGLMLALPMSFLFEQQRIVLNAELVFAMAWAVLVLSISAIFLLMVLIREGEVSQVASLFYLVPGVTALMAWLLFGETLNLVQIIGMVITTFGVALATRQAASSKPGSRDSR